MTKNLKNFFIRLSAISNHHHRRHHPKTFASRFEKKLLLLGTFSKNMSKHTSWAIVLVAWQQHPASHSLSISYITGDTDNKKMSKHTFAIYKENLSELIVSLHEKDRLYFKDTTLSNRLVKILRIQPQEKFILFDETIHVELVAHENMFINKREIDSTIQKKSPNTPLAPHITLLLPILKKEALEQAAYVAAQMGVTQVIPVVTKKSEQKLSEKEIERLQKIMIAACEQSKNFTPPTLHKIQSLTQSIHQDGYKICFDEDGSPLATLITNLKNVSDTPLLVTLGPEGGFVEDEKKALQTAGFNFYKLTPTILRSREAVTVGLGIIRAVGLA